MIKLLRQSFVALFVLALALVAQIPHAAYVFDNVAGPLAKGDWTLLGFSYAIALELAVLMFVVHGKQAESYAFAFASVLVNLSYYAMHNVQLWSLAAFPAWLIAFMLPVAIARYSHVIAEVEGTREDMPQVPESLRFVAVWLRTQVGVSLPFAQDVAPAQLPDSPTMQVEFPQEIAQEFEEVELQDVASEVPQDSQVEFAQPEPEPLTELPQVEVMQTAKETVQELAPTATVLPVNDLRKRAQKLRSKGKTLDEIAAQVGRSTTWVSRNTQAVSA